VLTLRQAEIATKYVESYPHLRALVRSAQDGDERACKHLGDSMGRLSYPSWVSGSDALSIAEIGAA
jgi:hypothetical protein